VNYCAWIPHSFNATFTRAACMVHREPQFATEATFAPLPHNLIPSLHMQAAGSA